VEYTPPPTWQKAGPPLPLGCADDIIMILVMIRITPTPWYSLTSLLNVTFSARIPPFSDTGLSERTVPRRGLAAATGRRHVSMRHYRRDFARLDGPAINMIPPRRPFRPMNRGNPSQYRAHASGVLRCGGTFTGSIAHTALATTRPGPRLAASPASSEPVRLRDRVRHIYHRLPHRHAPPRRTRSVSCRYAAPA